MGILDFLGLSGEQSASDVDSVESIKRITRQLEELDPQKARFIAAFAYLLGRVAHADRIISAEEDQVMERILNKKAKLPREQAVMIIEIAKRQNRLFGHVENFLVTREFNDLASRRQKLDLVECMFAVCASDQTVTVSEDNEIRQVASELLLEHREFIDIRSKYRKHLEVLKQSGEDQD
jgi:uncharacterized tellurite resistance protein B-like protein